MKLQSLASRIHPQVALNQREAHHLLTVLQSSFRKQLDLSHPTAACSKPRSPLPSSKHGEGVACSPRSSQASAVRHLDIVLSNPLFVASTQPDNPSFETNTLAVIKDPVAWFTTRVAHGTADRSSARLCLSILTNATSKAPSALSELRETLRHQKAGTRVLEWMWSYGLSDLDQVQQDTELMTLLIKPLVAEQRQDVIESWLLDPSTKKKEGYKRLLLERFLRAEVVLGADLNNVITYFWDMSNRLRSAFPDCHKSVASITRTAGLFVTLEMIRHGSSVKQDLYSKWIEGVGNWSNKSSFYTALLKVNDPRAPDAGLALKYLERGEDLEKGQRMVRLCLDSAEVFISQEDFAAASWVMEYAKRHFGAELGFKAKKEEGRSSGNELERTLQHDVDERHHLELLSQLSFG